MAYQGPNHERFSLLWGLFDIETVEKYTTIIEGPSGWRMSVNSRGRSCRA